MGEGLMGRRTQLFSHTPLSFSDKNASKAVTVERGVSPRRARFLISEKSGTFDFTGQIHLVAIAHHRRLIFVFGTRRGVRRGEKGRVRAKPSGVAVSMPSR
jgi:hypothetical protein